METTFKEVAQSPIAQDEEGNVLYFVKKETGTGKEEIVTLAKLKTLEYRLFRKMREKLRGYYGSDKDVKKGENVHTKTKERFDEIAKKFEKEATDLMEGGQNSLPHPLEYYLELFKCAYDFL